MPTHLLLTGATGYIGGDFLHALLSTTAPNQQTYDITCLVRSSDKAAQVAKQYPGVKFVYGSLAVVSGEGGVLEVEAGKADVVMHFADADSKPAVQAIIRGLAATHSSSRPGFLIHTSGTGTLMYADVQGSRYGEAPTDGDIYHDLSDGLAEMRRKIPADFLRRGVDDLVCGAERATDGAVKAAVVCPPLIYGQGRGPANQRSMQIPELVRVTLERGKGVVVGKGKNCWSCVHVHDLSNSYLKLVENAAAGESLAEWPGKPALWGEEGFFFCESGEVRMQELAQEVVAQAKKQGYLKNEKEEVEGIGPEEASQSTHRGDVLWGCNSRSRAKRAREALGWEPVGKGWKEVVEEQVGMEAEALGLKTGHAKKAAGDA